MASAPLKVFLGWDPREAEAYAVAVASIRERTSSPIEIDPIRLDRLWQRGWYRRQTAIRDGRLWDVLSDAPMSTEHAIARFFVPLLADLWGWVLSADCDILCRADLVELFALADPRYAVMVVKHQHQPEDSTKMDGQIQTAYPRKNWSSVILWNCGHPAHHALTDDLLNTRPGRDLHAFCWLRDEEIGALPARWNHLVGVMPYDPDAAIAHFTLGTPDMPAYEESAFADEWRWYLRGVA